MARVAVSLGNARVEGRSRDWIQLLTTAAAALVAGCAPAPATEPPPPIIDVHLHAHAADHQGPPPRAICAPFTVFPAWDPRLPWGVTLAEWMRDPPCDHPLWSAPTDDALRRGTLEVLERRNIIGVLSGPPDRVRQWREEAPGRIIPGLELFGRGVDVSPQQLRELHAAGRVAVLAEVVSQYSGIAPADSGWPRTGRWPRSWTLRSAFTSRRERGTHLPDDDGHGRRKPAAGAHAPRHAPRTPDVPRPARPSPRPRAPAFLGAYMSPAGEVAQSRVLRTRDCQVPELDVGGKGMSDGIAVASG